MGPEIKALQVNSAMFLHQNGRQNHNKKMAEKFFNLVKSKYFGKTA
jgi:hypothetical protein